jgi:hypothetical protein
LNSEGELSLSSDPDASPYYMEAELNSPMCRLRPGEICSFDTEWFPTRSGSDFHGVTDAGIVIRPLQATAAENGKINLLGAYGVFYSGHLVAHFYDKHGNGIGILPVGEVSPVESVALQKEVTPTGKASRVSIHLLDENGVDRGALQEVQVRDRENH